jgi:arylsulfatase A-like enzyme
MFKKILLRAAIVLVIAAIIVCGLTKKKPIRVVLIIFDTLRYDALMGSEDRETSMPVTCALAEQGLIFTRFYSATSTTQPSHATKFTALHPWQHGVSRNGQVLDEKYTTLTKVLKEHGFSTSATVSAFPVGSRMGFAQGFDRYKEDYRMGAMSKGQYVLANIITETALNQIDTANGRKQFFWFHFWDPHAPYGDTSGTNKSLPLPRSLLAASVAEGKSFEELTAMVHEFHKYYDYDVAYLDRQVSRIYERLKADADKFETHIVVVADHGESFGEDGSVAHGRRVTPWQIHVPCFIVSPKVEPNIRNDIAGSIDIFPTILSLAGVKYKVPGGRDLTIASNGPTYAFGMRNTLEKNYEELRLDGKIYVHDYNIFYAVYPDGRLFRGNRNLLLDSPVGTEVLTKESAEQLHSLFGQFEDELNSIEAVELTDEKTIKALETLGYVR